MKYSFTIKINFTGGVISPGDLLRILSVVKKAGIGTVSFGLRQQLLIEVSSEDYAEFTEQLDESGISYETDDEKYPNIVSSYPAEEVFITKTWLSEGIYKDIFDSFDYRPSLKVNISDSNQSFTPLLTGNINWIASTNVHFWHLVIRFPKTNVIYHWKDIVYTNDIASITRKMEQTILQHKPAFFDNKAADGELLYSKVTQGEHYITKQPDSVLKLPPFSLPYYEGLNKYNDKYWLGIYRRNEQFSVKFLQDICMICLSTKIGQLCSTPWKSLIIKGIEDKARPIWNEVLGKYQVNVRHAANELNFQVEDNCKAGLHIKQFLVKYLNKYDTRTFGICIGIKTRKKSEVFSTILVRRKSFFTIWGVGFFNLYDILFAHDFNPNERTGHIFSKNNIKFFLPEQLRMAIVSFYKHSGRNEDKLKKITSKKEPIAKPVAEKFIYQCKSCLTVYDEAIGEPSLEVPSGTSFNELPEDFCCHICESPKSNFKKVANEKLYYQTEKVMH